jgi:hypothetical protein
MPRKASRPVKMGPRWAGGRGAAQRGGLVSGCQPRGGYEALTTSLGPPTVIAVTRIRAARRADLGGDAWMGTGALPELI